MKVLSLNLWFSDYLRKERSLIFINYILENNYETNADMNEDGIIDVLDVIELINLIL